MARKRPTIYFDGQMTIPFEEFNIPAHIPVPDGGVLRTEDYPQVRHTDNPATRVINYMSFGSGSSGNCSYVGTRHGGFLIDAGVKAEDVMMTLKANGVRMENVKGILLTHDHSDHVKYAYTLLRANKHMRLFCTNRVLNGVLRRHGISKRIKDYHV
ncbi:MAG: MBL fold metallo-hydrolase, partial [Muribaculaceae bacterium]|nr:MBL fold metallo-hydrolase [Muribaculaceae bacterium]